MSVLTILIPQIEKALADVPSDQVPELLGDLERLKAALWARLITPAHNGQPQPLPSNETGRLLSPEDAAALLGVKVTWLYRNAKHLPFARKLSRKALRFSEAGLRRWQATRGA